MTVNLGSNAYPYNYSDMTGDVLARNTAPRGSWNIVCDGVKPGTEWGTISWLESTPDSTDIIVEVRAADEQVNLAQKVFIPVDNDSTFEGISGRFIEVQVILSRARGGLPSPVLYELTIAPRVLNQPPDCSAAAASLAELWPPDHAMVPVNILGISDPDSDAVVVEILGVTSDESVDATGDGNFCADAVIDGENVLLRSERSGNGDGRVYTITYRARDERGAQCEGSVTVCVPKSQGIRGRACLKGTSEFDATACGDKVSEPSARVVDESGRKRISVLQQDPGRVDINIYDVTGRLIRRIAGDDVGAGQHEWYWDGRDEQNRRASAGIYFIRVQTPDISRTMRILWLAR